MAHGHAWIIAVKAKKRSFPRDLEEPGMGNDRRRGNRLSAVLHRLLLFLIGWFPAQRFRASEAAADAKRDGQAPLPRGEHHTARQFHRPLNAKSSCPAMLKRQSATPRSIHALLAS